MVREIHLARILYTDMSALKVRPILIVQEYKAHDFLYLPLTTNLRTEGFRVSSNDLERGRLVKPSVVVVGKVAIIHKSQLVGQVGVLKSEAFERVKQGMCKSLRCS
jgi:mRNA-degrading endonuclease toxin of MazEF toxin-antitoxin module